LQADDTQSGDQQFAEAEGMDVSVRRPELRLLSLGFILLMRDVGSPGAGRARPFVLEMMGQSSGAG